MLPLYVDFNMIDTLPDGTESVPINFAPGNPEKLKKQFRPGSRVTLYDEGMKCEAVLREAAVLFGWTADIAGPFEDIDQTEFASLEIQTRQAAANASD